MNGIVKSDEYMIPAVSDVSAIIATFFVNANMSMPTLYEIWLNMYTLRVPLKIKYRVALLISGITFDSIDLKFNYKRYC